MVRGAERGLPEKTGDPGPGLCLDIHVSCWAPAHRLCARLGCGRDGVKSGRGLDVDARGTTCPRDASELRQCQALPPVPTPGPHPWTALPPCLLLWQSKGWSCLPACRNHSPASLPRPLAGCCVTSGKIPTYPDFKFSNFFKGRI